MALAYEPVRESARVREEAPRDVMAPLVATLDVGVAKTVCLAARRDPVLEMHPDRPMRVLGIGVQTAPAIASGKPADFDACARAIQVSIEEAAAMAGAPINRVVASYSGPGVASRISRGAVRLKSGAVTGRDIDAAINAAVQASPAPNLAILHVEPLRYMIDDGAPIDDPYGMSGKTLAVEACIVTAPGDAVNALKSCVRAAGADVEEIVAAPQAAALAVMTAEEREMGTLVVDLGAGSIGLAAYAAEGLVYAETVTCGGGVRMTRDLAAKLQTTFAAAERVKMHFGAVGNACDPREAVSAPKLGLDGRLEAATTLRGVIVDTLTPRLTEMLLLARQQLSRAGFSGAAGPQRAILVGGGAQMPGVRELAAEVLGMPVRLGRPHDLCGFDQYEAGPGYAASAGLLRHRFDNPQLADVEEHFAPSLSHVASMMRDTMGKAWNWLRDNF